MRKEPRLVQHEARGTREILERGTAAQLLELVAGGAVAKLGLVAQREERFVTARRGTGGGGLEHSLAAHVRPLTGARRLREGAVMADVPAELRQRDEDLRRVGDEPAVARVAKAPRLGAELAERAIEQLGGPHPATLRIQL